MEEVGDEEGEGGEHVEGEGGAGGQGKLGGGQQVPGIVKLLLLHFIINTKGFHKKFCISWKAKNY